MIEVVFLDAGDTLIHPHPSFPELFASVCRQGGLDVSAPDVSRVQRRLAPRLVDIAEETGVRRGPSLSKEDSQTFWLYLYRRFLDELGSADEVLAARLYDTFSSSSSYALFEDVLPALRRLLAAGLRLGLISNFEGWLENMLVELEVGHLFDVSVISGIEGVEKPDPRIYELALHRAGADPGRCLHVGDSPELDVEPARAVGMEAVLLDRARLHPSPDCTVIGTLEELPEVVAKL